MNVTLLVNAAKNKKKKKNWWRRRFSAWRKDLVSPRSASCTGAMTGIYLTTQSSGELLLSHHVFIFIWFHLVKPFLEMWWPGDWSHRALSIWSLFCSLIRMNMMPWAMWTLAVVLCNFPKGHSTQHTCLDHGLRTPWNQSWIFTRIHLKCPLKQHIQAMGCIHFWDGCSL